MQCQICELYTVCPPVLELLITLVQIHVGMSVASNSAVPHGWLRWLSFRFSICSSDCHGFTWLFWAPSKHNKNPSGRGANDYCCKGVKVCWVANVLAHFSLTFSNHILLDQSRLEFWDFWSVALPEPLANTWCSGEDAPAGDSVLCMWEHSSPTPVAWSMRAACPQLA